MNSSQENKRRRWRSDRHKNKEKQRIKRKESDDQSVRSGRKRKRLKRKVLQDTQETKKYELKNNNKSRMNRHKLTENRTNTKMKRRSRKVNKEKERTLFPFKRTVISLGLVFVLALIAYTTIIYGGKLIIDEEKLVITGPTTIETKDGEVVWQLYEQYRLPVDSEQIPQHVKDAFVAIEDKRFYSHSGVDFRSVARAVYRDIVARSKAEGASTLTQQLAKNLFLSNDKSWIRKIEEAMIAVYLEREFSKDEILEMYLNVIYFGQGQYGIEAAANKFFNKSVEDLTIEEGALFAGIIKAPNGYSPINHKEKAIDRRNLVLQEMSEQGYISNEEAEVAQASALNLDVTERSFNPAYHSFVDLVIQETEELYGITLEELRNNRYQLITSLDIEAQTIAFNEFKDDSYFPGNNMEAVEGAFVMMDQEQGEIVATIGGRHFQSGDLNRVERPIGQPGSIMKPIAVFAPALETEQFTPFSVLPDELEDWDGLPVRNHNNQYEGEVTFYNALKHSKNTSSVWLLNEIGIDYAKSYLQKMGIEIEDNNVRIALGGLKQGLTPIQLAQSYRTFAHEGEMIDAHTVVEIRNNKEETIATANPETVEVFSDQVAWYITEMLKSVVQDGTGTAGSYPHELAGKTGSTQHPIKEGETKDAWFVGYTPEYVTALWMGYDDISEGDYYLTGGSSYPTQLTKKILTELDKQKSLVAEFTKPEHVRALAEPIDLPVITDLSSSFVFGGLKLVKSKLEWTGTNDDRIVYRVYEENGDDDRYIGEAQADNEFVIDKFSLFDSSSYYIVPYDPLAQLEGERSNTVKLTF